jgi:GNAT superfamily N-acetyltransferase
MRRHITYTVGMSYSAPPSGWSDDDFWTRSIGDGLILRATERPDSPLLEHFFSGYDRAFVLPDEREELEGFRACLAINPASRERFGRRHREMVVVVDDVASGQLLGGANFLSTRINHPPANHPPVAVALNYLFVEAAARGKGLARRLSAEVARLANRAVDAADDAPPPALFIEQNDPLRLSDADYAADSEHAGIDQIDRLAVWAKMGALLVDFAYVQPSLSADQDCDDGLAYAVMNMGVEAIDAAYLRAHLESFFGISVLKGGDPGADPVARAQLSALAAMAAAEDAVRLMTMKPAIDALRALPSRPKGTTLRDFARGLVQNGGEDGAFSQA